MFSQESVVQHTTLDVLFLYLLGYKRKKLLVREDVFRTHSRWFLLKRLRCVSLCKKTDKNTQRWIILRRCNQKALQNHLNQFFISYYKNPVQIHGHRLSWQEWVDFVWNLWLKRNDGQKKLEFSFASKGSILSEVSDACAFCYMCNSVSGLVFHDTDSVRGVFFDPKNNCAYVTYKTDYIQGQRILNALSGALMAGWRTRPGVRWALYKEHQISFHSASSKQKRLLDMLLEAGLRVPIALAVKQLELKTANKEGAKARLYDLGNQLRSKAVQACRGTKDKVTFEISVAGDWVQMVEAKP